MLFSTESYPFIFIPVKSPFRIFVKFPLFHFHPHFFAILITKKNLQMQRCFNTEGSPFISIIETSPARIFVKFLSFQLLFLAFLVTYSLFMMSELRPWAHLKNGSASPNTNITTCETCCLGIPSIGCLEIITYCFVFSYLLEEIRQVVRHMILFFGGGGGS